MKYLFLAVMLLFSGSESWAAQKKKSSRGNPSKEAGRQFEKALKAQKTGDLHEAKRLLTRVQKNYSQVALNDEHDSDVESSEIPNVSNYGDYSAYLLKFLNREIKEGPERTFKSIEEAIADLQREIKAEDKIELEKSLWVEVAVKQCETHGNSKEPEEAAEVLLSKIKGKGKNLKTTEISGSDPALLLEISSNDFIKVGLTRHNDGWVWDQVVKCDQKPN